MVFGFIRKFSENLILKGVVAYINHHPEDVMEMGQHIQNAVFDPTPFELETADEVFDALLFSLLTTAKNTPADTDNWRHKLIGLGDQYKKESNKCGMYAYNLAAAAYSSALDAAKMKSGAVERCAEICEMITVSVMTVRNVDKLGGGGSHAETSRDHTKGSEEARDPDEFAPVVVDCPKCSAKLPVSSDKSGTIRCPKCSNAFEAKT